MTQLDVFFKKKFGACQVDSLLQYITSERMLTPPYASVFEAYFYWIIDEVLTSACFKFRAKAIKRIIKMGQFFFKAGNYCAFVTTLSALNQPAVTRLKKSWEKVSEKYIGWLLNQITVFLKGKPDTLRLIMLSQMQPYLPDLSVFKMDYEKALREGSQQQMNKITTIIVQLHQHLVLIFDQKKISQSYFINGVEKWMNASEKDLKERFFNRSCLLE